MLWLWFSRHSLGHVLRIHQLRFMKVSELIIELQKCHPDAEVWLPNVNNFNIPGYCVLDHNYEFSICRGRKRCDG